MPTRLPGFAVLAAALSALALAQGLGSGRGPAVTVLAVAGTASVALGRRRPLAALSGVAASVVGQVLVEPADPLFASFVALMAGFYALGRRADRVGTALGTAAAAAAVAVLVLRDPRPFVPTDLVFPVVYFGVGLLAGRLAAARDRDAAAALAAAEREARARERTVLAEERARIAREMHDVVAHSVSLLVVQAEAAAAVLPTDPAAASRQVERIADSGRQSLLELRRVLGVLRADGDDREPAPVPRLADLDELADAVRRAGTHVRLDVVGRLEDVPPGLQLAVYRVVQEALTNAVRHGRPRAVAVRVHRSGGAVELDVTDDGCGGSAGAGGHGLVGMRERLRAYGGTLDAGPRPEGGWRVQASVPVPTA